MEGVTFCELPSRWRPMEGVTFCELPSQGVQWRQLLGQDMQFRKLPSQGFQWRQLLSQWSQLLSQLLDLAPHVFMRKLLLTRRSSPSPQIALSRKVARSVITPSWAQVSLGKGATDLSKQP